MVGEEEVEEGEDEVVAGESDFFFDQDWERFELVLIQTKRVGVGARWV